MNLTEQMSARSELVKKMRALHEGAADRALTVEEERAWDALDLEQGRLGEDIERARRSSVVSYREGRIYAKDRAGLVALEEELKSRTTHSGLRPTPNNGAVRTAHPGEMRVLAPSEQLRDHLDVELPSDVKIPDLSIGRVVRALITGTWTGAEAEQRTMSTLVLTSGGAMVPDAISATVLDAARNAAVVFAAGAQTVPMDTKELAFARVATDPVASWKGENQAASESDVGLEQLTLRSKTLVGLVRVSGELMADAPNGPRVVEDTLAASLAQALDLAALRDVGPVSPSGVIGYEPATQTITSVGFLSLDDYANAANLILQANGPSTGLSAILTPRDYGAIDKMKDGNGAPLLGPPSWQAMRKFPTNQLRATLGVSETESESVVGNFAGMFIGMRTALRLDVSREADTAFARYQYLVRAVLRADVLLANERHWVVLSGILPSS